MAKKTTGKASRTPAQKANDKRLGQMAKARAAAKHGSHAKPAAKKPKAKRSYAKPAAKSHSHASHGSGHSHSAKPKVIYKKNPVPGLTTAKGLLQGNILPAAIGAGTALGYDLIWGKIPFIPATWRAGALKYPVKFIMALGLGVGAEHLLGKKHRELVTTMVRGPLTVILHDAGKDLINKQFPTVGLAAYQADTLAEVMHLNGLLDTPQVTGHLAEPDIQRMAGLGEGWAPKKLPYCRPAANATPGTQQHQPAAHPVARGPVKAPAHAAAAAKPGAAHPHARIFGGAKFFNYPGVAA